MTNVQLTLLSYITMEIAVYPLVNLHNWWENHNSQWVNPLKITIFNGYVKLPEGRSSGWWFGLWISFFPSYWEFHPPNWRTHIFQRGWNHQPVIDGKLWTLITDYILTIYIICSISVHNIMYTCIIFMHNIYLKRCA